jgi:apolipoprotein N-acyltransferase
MISKNASLEDLTVLCLGSLAFAFIGWRYNMALAALVAPPLLMRFFRRRERWYGALLALPPLALGSGIAMWKAWDLEPWMMILLPVLRAALLMIPLYLDRAARRRLGPIASTLVFPAAAIAFEYGLSFSPFATVLSGGVGLYGLRELAQTASLAGIWGLGFLVYWLAPAINAFAEAGFNLRAAGSSAILPLGILGAALAYGAIRVGTDPVDAPTVRIAGVSAEHPRDYWDLIEEGSPRAKVRDLVGETEATEDALFSSSARGVAAGAKIVLWSEGACVLDEEREARFVARAGAFSSDKGIYLAAAVLVFHFGSGISDNKVLLFTPEGRLAFTYVKTISWFPTGSDGILKVLDTPYGRLGAAICFDMDTPAFAHRLAGLGADIVLVPSFDSGKVRPFHTEVGLFRAVENGYSMFRQVAEGSSMAVDGRGVERGFQDYFAAPDRLFLADLPVKAEKTLYGALGDLFAWLDLALLAVLGALALRRRRRTGLPS